MREILLVFVGGGVGSLLRLFSTKWFNPLFDKFPFGTFVANAVSCLVFGFFAYLLTSKFVDNTLMRPLILVGICGGFSTFSTFSNELLDMLKIGNYFFFILYLLASVLVAISFLFLGMFMAKLL